MWTVMAYDDAGRSGGPGGGVELLHYLHGNLIGTTERMTDHPAHGGSTPAGTRYGYAETV